MLNEMAFFMKVFLRCATKDFLIEALFYVLHLGVFWNLFSDDQSPLRAFWRSVAT